MVPFCQFTGAVTRLPVHKSDITGADVPVPGLQDTHVIAYAGCFRFPQNVFLSKILVGVKLLAIDEVVYLTPCAIVRSVMVSTLGWRTMRLETGWMGYLSKRTSNKVSSCVLDEAIALHLEPMVVDMDPIALTWDPIAMD